MRSLAVYAALIALAGCDENVSANSVDRQPPPPSVDVAAPMIKPIVEWDEYTGQFEAQTEVDVRARVSGYLESVHFKDGQIVTKGQLLYVIDRRPFEAALARAEAVEARARSQLKLADLTLKRGEALLKRKVIAENELDVRRANRAVAIADLSAAEADRRLAELDLGFATIKAPLTGRISDTRVDVGNVISGGTTDSTLLTTIVSLDPIYFRFDASEADVLRYRRLNSEGRRPSSRDNPNPVYVRLMDETKWKRKGVMNFVDNRLDRNSGTIRARASFPNPDYFISPGMFGRLRLIGSSEYEAILLPDESILSDQARKIVMTVDEKGMVSGKPVVLGPIVDGLRVIRSGLTKGDKVVVRGIQRARPGQQVAPVKVTIGPSGKIVPSE